MPFHRTLISRCAALVLGLCAAHGFAQGTRPEPPSGKPPAPPPEAIAACQGKAQGATVSFIGRRGETVSGTCEKIGDTLAARPSGPPPDGGKPTAR